MGSSTTDNAIDLCDYKVVITPQNGVVNNSLKLRDAVVAVVITPQNGVFNNKKLHKAFLIEVVITPQNGVFNNLITTQLEPKML